MLPRYYTMYHFRSKTNYGFQFDMRHIVLVVGTLTEVLLLVDQY